MKAIKTEYSHTILEMQFSLMLWALLMSTAITEQIMKDTSYITTTTILQTAPPSEHCTKLTVLSALHEVDSNVKFKVDCTHLHTKYSGIV